MGARGDLILMSHAKLNDKDFYLFL